MNTTNDNQNFTPEKGGKRKTYRKVKENHLVFHEHETAKNGLHKILVLDLYKNGLGKIYETINEQSGETEYIAHDMEGNFMFKRESIDAIKQQFINNKELLFQKAYEQRLSKIYAMRAAKEQGITKEKTEVRKAYQKQPVIQGSNKQAETTAGEKRIEELRELRENKEQDREQELSR